MKNRLFWHRTVLIACAAVITTTACLTTLSRPVSAASQYQSLVWSDEFNSGKTINTAKWSYDLGGGGWGNGELQAYTKDRKNISLTNGNLQIQGLYNSTTGQYTSAKVKTMNTASWLYGRIDVRAKLPRGVGSWPAIWMLPNGAKYGNQYLANGEIDIMEEVGADQNEIVASAHSLAFNPANQNVRYCTKIVDTADTEFHVYGLEWTPSYLSYQVDGTKFCRINNDYTGYLSWPYDQSYYLILNLAIGGSWGGYKGVDTTSLPWKFLVDYVRVYQ